MDEDVFEVGGYTLHCGEALTLPSDLAADGSLAVTMVDRLPGQTVIVPPERVQEFMTWFENCVLRQGVEQGRSE